MGRRKNSEQSIVDDLFGLLLVVPIWVGPILAAVAYAALRWGVSLIVGSPDQTDIMGKTISSVFTPLAILLAPWVGGMIIVFWIVAEIGKWINRNRLDKQTGIDSIRQLDWKQFELLLCEAFRRQGYVVDHVGKAGPDGGVDIRLSKSREITLVQCKHWKRDQVGVKIVRELMGVVTSEKANRGIVVTSGSFSEDARSFAESVPLQLIDGPKLVEMIRSVKSSPSFPIQNSSIVPVQNSPNAPIQNSSDLPRQASSNANPPQIPSCPKCGSVMQVRTAKQGTNAGSQFWGCTRYPNCRGTRQVTT